MLDLLHPTALRRLLLPQRGALANARDGARALDLLVQERHARDRAQARTRGTGSWAALGPSSGRHALHVAAGEADLVSRLADFVAEGLGAGEVCLVAASAAHRAGLRHRLDLMGLGPEVEAGLLVDVDVTDEVTRLLRDGRPAADLFDRHVASRLRARAAAGARLRVAGETVDLLLARDAVDEAVALERLWDALQAELGFPLLCLTGGRLDDDAKERVVAEHTHVVAAIG